MIHGYRTLFPIPLGMGSSWDPAVEERAQAFAAAEARRAGKVFPSMFDAFLRHSPVPPPTPAEVADWVGKAKAAAEQADVIIAVVGEPAFMSGEGASRGTLGLPGIQQQLVEAAASSGKPLIVVLENGRPLAINWIAEHATTILESWFPGVEGGNAVVDVLFGDVNPGGKLPLSWPQSAGQEPLYYNHNLTHQPDTAAQFTSRYWDVPSEPSPASSTCGSARIPERICNGELTIEP